MNHCECGCKSGNYCWKSYRTIPKRSNWVKEYGKGGRRGQVPKGTRIPMKGHYGKYTRVFWANKAKDVKLDKLDDSWGIGHTTKGDSMWGTAERYDEDDRCDLFSMTNLKKGIGSTAWVTPISLEQMDMIQDKID